MVALIDGDPVPPADPVTVTGRAGVTCAVAKSGEVSLPAAVRVNVTVAAEFGSEAATVYATRLVVKMTFRMLEVVPSAAVVVWAAFKEVLKAVPPTTTQLTGVEGTGWP